MKDFLTADEIKILKEAHRSSQFRKNADRIKTVLLLNKGFSFEEVSQILMLDDQTIRRYVLTYKEKGIDGLLEDHYHGSKAFLTHEQEQKLIIHLRKTTYRKVSQIRAYVKNIYGVSYSIDGMTHLLHRLGFSYKKLKFVPGKLNLEKQEEWKKVYQQVKETKKAEDRIYFLDGCHPQHNSIASYGWIYTKDTKTVKTNTARKRINLNGAVNIEDMDVIVLKEPTINAEAAIRLVQEIEKQQPTGEIYLIMDNARYNHAKLFKAYVDKSKRIHLMYLPAYSPNLNIIERLWKFFKEEKLYGQYYETYTEFTSVVMDFFKNIEKYKKQLSTRLTDNFQTLAV